ncbi:phosphatidate cytidylyltransferase, partial [Spiromyces aspiralis]
MPRSTAKSAGKGGSLRQRKAASAGIKEREEPTHVKAAQQGVDIVGGDHTTESKKKWETVRNRTWFTFLMIGGFLMVLATGPTAIILMVFSLQMAIYKELIGLASVSSKERDLPWQRALNWHFLLTTEFYLYGHIFNRYLARVPLIGRYAPLMTSRHNIISFTLYLIGFVWFVATLRKGFYRFQLGLFAWTHMALVMVIFQTHFMVENIFAGIFWFFIPIMLVIVNDIFAYVFGFFFGRHSLISLSPKKTWEGYIGGGLATILFGFMFTSLLSRWDYVICPVERLSTNILSGYTCNHNPIFDRTQYVIPHWMSLILSVI